MRILLYLIFFTGLAWILAALYQPATTIDDHTGRIIATPSNSPQKRTPNLKSSSNDDSFPEPGLTFAPTLNSKPASSEISVEDSASDQRVTAMATMLALLPTPTATSLPAPTKARTLSPGDSTNAIISSLRDLQEPTDDARSNPGVRNSSPRSASDRSITPTPTPEGGLAWVTGQSTGYAMLAMMHPNARAMAERQIYALKKAHIRTPFIAALADGTFDFDQNFLVSSAQTLSTDGRRLTVLLYLSSGPTMRRWDTTPITAAFAQYEPESFRIAIRFDNSTRSRFQAIAERVKPAVQAILAIKPENKVIIVPSLEDNLDRESYRAIKELTRSTLGNGVQIVRNICPNCYPGNDTDSLGDPIEVHMQELVERLGPGDGFTLDGLGHRYDFEPEDDQLGESKIKQLKELAIQRDVSYFGLWRKQRQGLGNQLIHPDDRSYEVPNDAQVEADIALLRYGLELE